MTYTLTKGQRHLILNEISLQMYLKYLNDYNIDLKRICTKYSYNDSERNILNKLREDYMKNELPIKKKWIQK